MFNKGPGPGFIGTKPRPRIIPRNRSELNKYAITPYHRSRDFRKKIANLYYNVQVKHVEESKGQWPVFKLSNVPPPVEKEK